MRHSVLILPVQQLHINFNRIYRSPDRTKVTGHKFQGIAPVGEADVHAAIFEQPDLLQLLTVLKLPQVIPQVSILGQQIVYPVRVLTKGPSLKMRQSLQDVFRAVMDVPLLAVLGPLSAPDFPLSISG